MNLAATVMWTGEKRRLAITAADVCLKQVTRTNHNAFGNRLNSNVVLCVRSTAQQADQSESLFICPIHAFH